MDPARKSPVSHDPSQSSHWLQCASISRCIPLYSEPFPRSPTRLSLMKLLFPGRAWFQEGTPPKRTETILIWKGTVVPPFGLPANGITGCGVALNPVEWLESSPRGHYAKSRVVISWPRVGFFSVASSKVVAAAKLNACMDTVREGVYLALGEEQPARPRP